MHEILSIILKPSPLHWKKKFSKELSPEEINKRVVEDGLDGVGDKIKTVAINKNLENTLVREP